MTSVEFYFVTPGGVPIANTQFQVQLGRASFSPTISGVLMPRVVIGTTDSEGKAVLDLWPSPSIYYVEVNDPTSEAVIFYKFVVPTATQGTVLRLQDLVVDAVVTPPTSGGGSGVIAFNGRTGRVNLQGKDVSDALGFLPYSAAQVAAAIAAAAPGAISGITYDNASRVSGYTRGGVACTVTYPTSTSAVISGGNSSRTVTFDSAGRVTAII